MPRKAPQQEPMEVAQPEQPSYDLEPVTEDIQSRLNVMGNSMQLTANQLRHNAPGWASFIDDVFQTIGILVEANK